MSVAGACCFLQSGTRSTTQQPSFCLLATHSVSRRPQLQMTHRAATQHGRSSAAIAAGHASLDGSSSPTNSGAGSLSYRSSKRAFTVVSAAEGTHGDVSSEPRATRNQLDQFFTTLNKAYIAAQQNCDEADACVCEDQVRYAGWVGYCYYTVSERNNANIPALS